MYGGGLLQRGNGVSDREMIKKDRRMIFDSAVFSYDKLIAQQATKNPISNEWLISLSFLDTQRVGKITLEKAFFVN